MRWAIIGVTIAFLVVFVVVPLVNVFAQAFSRGLVAYIAAIGNPDALAAIRLTLIVAAISVLLNLVFGRGCRLGSSPNTNSPARAC